MAPPIPYSLLRERKQQVRTLDDPFISQLPKIELHIHIEGTLTPSLRFKLASRHQLLPLHSQRLQKDFNTLSELEEMYQLLEPPSSRGTGISAFYEAYYGSMEVLLEESDFFELAMGYFSKAREMNVKYCEILFDIQAHTRRGVSVSTVMDGFRLAQVKAEKELNVKSQWIACFLRNLPQESAMEHYELLIPYKDMIVGIGLDSNEFNHPPSLFYDLFQRARNDGFKLTCHCDVAQPATHSHIHQVATSLGGTGAERIDHGLDAASDPSLVQIIKEKGIGMTLCPWAYVRHHTEEDIFGYLRKLFAEDVKIMISSDSPVYVESLWLDDNLKLIRSNAGFTNEEFERLMGNAIDICWAKHEVKMAFREELAQFMENMRQMKI
ncbi:hypothetical protein HYFRA_00009878 [Hymenoscyphus fraxineus]|uniref:Adenosine deaminase domain-containing protein n=1 Tax=Hymenoscyphus fraxineus TaxID=746836 RepID=A0A9N9L4R7_9HELO|nr:hypothetical protein HYFRA_00009878 [Hymenoscyphus fraxineus]